MSTRIYVPGTWMGLGHTVALSTDTSIHLAPDWNRDRAKAYAVTQSLREALPELDDEALEHYAMTEAAQASLRNFYDEAEPMRRLVLAVDVDEVEEVPGEVCEVYADVAVPHDVVAWLVDTADAEAVVSRVAGCLPLTGQESTEEVERIEKAVEACLDHELAWYAADEVDQVMALV